MDAFVDDGYIAVSGRLKDEPDRTISVIPAANLVTLGADDMGSTIDASRQSCARVPCGGPPGGGGDKG